MPMFGDGHLHSFGVMIWSDIGCHIPSELGYYEPNSGDNGVIPLAFLVDAESVVLALNHAIVEVGFIRDGYFNFGFILGSCVVVKVQYHHCLWIRTNHFHKTSYCCKGFFLRFLRFYTSNALARKWLLFVTQKLFID